MRLDKYLAENREVTRALATKLIESGNCTVNDVIITSKKHIVKLCDEIRLNIPEPQKLDILPESIPLDIRYEDKHVIVINKPQGMVVHPAPGHYSGTLVNALMFHCGESLSGIAGTERVGIVHRIDKNTSGLLVVAKNNTAHISLSEQFKERTIQKEYEAVVHGRVRQSLGQGRGVFTINAPLGRSVHDRKRMCVATANFKGTAREAITHYKALSVYDKFSHIRIKLETGRTHQIRVHMSYVGHSLAGDSVYGDGKPTFLNGQCLHAKRLVFNHPNSGELIEIESELPDYFKEFLRKLQKN
ncbi:MAG: RluA family pseudouridine synthase [Oscillospiraceae bacterium]|nr:RluA family pseudouridine synthase [Oscillospiraceae bacterium]